MNRTMLYLITISIVLAACGPSESEIQAKVQTSIAQTQAAMPTATAMLTATPIPFSALDLEQVVITNGDLPAGFEAGQIRNKRGDLTKNAATPDYFFSQSFSRGENFGGLVDILVYEDIGQVESAYDLAAQNMPGSKSNVDVGEKGQVATNNLFLDVASLTFVRCHAIVSIQFLGNSNSGDVVAYASRLDKRLKPIVCR